MSRKAPSQATLRRWDKKGYPHKGWICSSVFEDEQLSGICQMCGETSLRWLHNLNHNEQGTIVQVGRICAGYLQEDYDNAKIQQRLAFNESKRKQTFLAREWKTYDHPEKGTLYYLQTGKAEIRVTHDHRGWLISDFHRKSDMKHIIYKHDHVDFDKITAELFEIHDSLNES